MEADAITCAPTAPPSGAARVAASGSRPKAPPLTALARPASWPLSVAQTQWLSVRSAVQSQRQQLVMKLTGRVNAAALSRSFERLQRRHEILRTRYIETPRGVVQHIHPEPAPLGFCEPPGASPRSRWRAAATMVSREMLAPTDLSQGPISLTHFKIADDLSYLAGSIHHIAWDGDSHVQFWREFFASYFNAVLGLPGGPPAVKVQYADFALWEGALLDPAARSANDLFWNDLLADAEPPRLPDGREIGDAHSPIGLGRLNIGGKLFSRGADFARRQGATPAHLIKALIAIALARWAGQSRTVIVDVLNLRPAGLQDSIGCYIQCRPVPVDLSGDPSFSKALGRARKAIISASDGRRPPPQSAFDTLGKEGVSINLRTGPVRDKEPPRKVLGVVAELGDLPRRMKRSEMSRDMAFSLHQNPKRIRGTMSYAADRFDAAQITAFIDSISAILERGLADPDAPLSAVLADLPAIGPRVEAPAC